MTAIYQLRGFTTMTSPDDELYEETSDVPKGRTSRTISDKLWAALETSARRQIAYQRTGTQEAIDELRKDLTSHAVRNKFTVTTSTAKLEDGRHRLKFAAQAVPDEDNGEQEVDTQEATAPPAPQPDADPEPTAQVPKQHSKK